MQVKTQELMKTKQVELFGQILEVEVVENDRPQQFQNKREEKKFKPAVHVMLKDSKGKVIGKGSAFCGPRDTYNAAYGARIALHRAIDRVAEGYVKGLKTKATTSCFGSW